MKSSAVPPIATSLNFENRKNYTYQERTEIREYNGSGKLFKTDIVTKEILILEGQPYEKLIARNDKPLSEKDAAKEQKKLDKEVEKRRNQSKSEKARLEKERLEDQKYMREFTEAFDFRAIGESRQRQAYLDYFGNAQAGFSAEEFRCENVHETPRQGLDR